MPSINQTPPKRNSYFHIYEDPESPDHWQLSAGASKKALRRALLALLGLLLLALNVPGAAELVSALIQ